MSRASGRSARSQSLWRNRDFTVLWSIETLSQVGAQVSVIALPLTAVVVLGAGPGDVGVLMALQFLPVVLVTLFAGAWLDRHRRRPALVVTNAVRFVLLAGIPVAYLTGGLTLYLLYGITFLAGCMTAVADVAYLVYLPSLVRDDQLLDANAKLEATYSVALIGGPGLGGVLVQLVGPPLAMLADAITYLLACLGLTAIRTPEAVPSSDEDRAGMRAEIAMGLRTILGHPVLRSLISLAAVFNLFEQVVMTLYVLFAVQDLGLSPGVLGLALGIGSVGGLIGSVAAARLSGSLRAGRAALVAAFIGAAGLAIVPLAGGGQWVAALILIAAFLVYGFGLAAFNVISLSLRTTIVSPALLGRVTASFRLLVYGTIPVGALLAGVLGDAIGVRAAVAVGALALLAATVLFWATGLRHADLDVDDVLVEPTQTSESER